MVIHLDIGGEGRHAGAINVNPQGLTTTTGVPGRPIPDLVVARGEALPFASGVADMVTVENAPIRDATLDEIARVLKPGGTVRLLHPTDYAIGQGVHDAVAGAIRANRAAMVQSFLPDGTTLTVLRRAVDLLR